MGVPAPGSGPAHTRFAELAGRPPHQVYSRQAAAGPHADQLDASHGADRQAVVCRELTKTHEEIVRGTLAELAAWAPRRAAASGAVRGEITLVVAGTGR